MRELSIIDKKIKFIIEESGYSLTEFAKKSNRMGYPMTRQTLSAIVNGRDPYPSVQILNSIVKVCHKLGNDNLKHVTFDYLLNDDIKDFDAINANFHYELGLSEESIEELKFENCPMVDASKEIDYFLSHSRYHYWDNLANIRTINGILDYIKYPKKIDREVLKEKLSVLINFEYHIATYIDQFFSDFGRDVKKLIKDMDKLDDFKLQMYLNDIKERLVILNAAYKNNVLEKTRDIVEGIK